jgi:hypothetical protein
MVWLVLKHTELWGKSELEFTVEEWSRISEYFYGKDYRVCKYFMHQCRKPTHNEVFEPEEDRLLLELASEKTGKIKWSELALELYLRSGEKYFKRSKQYR